MQLVVLAAGHGRRFGGLKQLAPVGPEGEAIMDYTAWSALAAGFDEIVLVVRQEVEDELLAHVAGHWPDGLKVTPVRQGPVAGTAQAVASAGAHVRGSFGVANADDLYGEGAIALLAETLTGLRAKEHLILSYELSKTVITDAAVTRGICAVDDLSALEKVVEMSVRRLPDGSFAARPVDADGAAASTEVQGEAPVSMNLWGLSEGIFGELEEAIAAFEPPPAPEGTKPPELLLPAVIGDLVERGRCRVRVVPAPGSCIGITHPEDLPLVRQLVSRLGSPSGAPSRPLPGSR